MSTGYLNFRSRMYCSQLGRFLGRDSLGYKGGLNLYPGGMMLSFVDPSGNQIEFPQPWDSGLVAHVFENTTTCNVSLATHAHKTSPNSEQLSREDFNTIAGGGLLNTNAITFSDVIIATEKETSWVTCCHKIPGKCGKKCPTGTCCTECAVDGSIASYAFFDEGASTWRGADSELVLRHERYHLKVTELIACRARNLDPGPQVFKNCLENNSIVLAKKAWNRKFNSRLKTVLAQWKPYQDRYDSGVSHENLNPEKQREWEKKIDADLQACQAINGG